MLEISLIRDNELVFDTFDMCKYMKNKNPDFKIMDKMENKFKKLMDKDVNVRYLYSIAIGATGPLMVNSIAYANELNGVTEKIRTITSPVIELLAGLGYPVTYGMLITGALMIITGKKSKGLDVIKWSCMGYIGLQFVPFLLNLLEMIGRELRMSL